MYKDSFPKKKYKKLKDFCNDYALALGNYMNNFDYNLDRAAKLIEKTILAKRTIFVCGNGGSSAIANHYVCDYIKSLSSNTNLKPRLLSLNSNSELISAISNDISYDKIFSYQMESYSQSGDLLVLISSSGESKNIRDVIKFSKRKKIKTIGFSGFEGGYLKKNSDISIHVNINNYGITEDIFQIYMHIIMQYLRQKNIKTNKLDKLKF